MKITKEWLEQQGACADGKEWFNTQKATRVDTIIKKLVVEAKFDWADWVITRLMTHEQNVRYACFSSLQSIEIFEKEFPNDKRPREAIEAALRWADDPTEENRSAAESAAESASWPAAWSAESAACLAAWQA